MTADTFTATLATSAATKPVAPMLQVHPHATARPVSVPRMLALLVGVDAVVAAAAMVTGLSTRFGDSFHASAPGTALLVAVFSVAWLAAMALGGSYDPRFLAAGPQEYRRVVNAAVWLGAAMAIASFMLRLELSRGFVAITIPAALVLTLTGRCSLRRLLQRRLAAGHTIHRVAVVGTSVSGERLARHLRQHSFAGYEVVGTLGRIPDVHADDRSIQQKQARALLRDLIADARRMGADTIAVTSAEALGHAGIRRLSWELEGSGMRLVVAPNVADVAGPRIVIRPVAGLPLLHIDEPSFGGAQRVVKECIDRAGAAILLALVSPVMAAIAIAALIKQGRPILYRQERIGQHGRVFTMHKFRSMRNGAINELEALAHLNQHAGEMFKIRKDPRITPLGSFLRRYSLDELPQLWDVVTGSMSLVGPRPPLAAEVELYSIDAHRRLLVKPGITGLWQVSGRSDLSWDETVRLDLHYVENWSVALDFTLLWKTLFAVMKTSGAY